MFNNTILKKAIKAKREVLSFFFRIHLIGRLKSSQMKSTYSTFQKEIFVDQEKTQFSS